MLIAQPPFVCLLLLIISPERVKLQAANMCKRIAEGQQRWRILTGHVISTQKANLFDECAALCVGNPACYSVNYYDRKRKCELNDKTSFNNPEHIIVEDGSYLDIHRPYNDCSDLFCNLEDACVMDRVDHFYCKACNSPLGMESGKIKDSQITASSVYSENTSLQPSSGRLNNRVGHWAPRRPHQENEWLQIDFIQKVTLTKVATQGISIEAVKQWVTSYKIKSSKDAILWEFFTEEGQEKIFAGNTDTSTVVSHVLSPKVRHVRYVKFVVISWRIFIDLRVEVYGCEE